MTDREELEAEILRLKLIFAEDVSRAVGVLQACAYKRFESSEYLVKEADKLQAAVRKALEPTDD